MPKNPLKALIRRFLAKTFDNSRRKLSIAAVMATHNSELHLEKILEHFRRNQIDVYLIDNQSRDNTLAIIQKFYHNPVAEVIHEPFDGVFRLRRQLELKQMIVQKLDADWIIHADADEIFQSPRAGESLRAMVERQHAAGYDIIDCDEFVFVPESEDKDYADTDFVQTIRNYYYFWQPKRKTLHRVMRTSSGPPDWHISGGHQLSSKRSVSPEKLRMRHYPGLSLDHLRSQYLGRVFDGAELQRWHRNRVPTAMDFIVAPPVKRLFNLDTHGWKTEQPENQHLIFYQPRQYMPPAKLQADNARPPMPFVVGVGRSGTTLLRLLLDAHPKLAMTPETHWLTQAIKKLSQDSQDIDGLRKILLTHPYWKDMGIVDSKLDQILHNHDPDQPADTIRRIYHCYSQRFGVDRVGDKTPLHNLSMYDICRFLPEARFIHLIRDGRDVAISHRGLWFGPSDDPKSAAMFWMWRIRETRQQAQFIPHYHEVFYENLVTDPEAELKKICAFIDLDFHPDQLLAHERAQDRLSELNDVVHKGKVITSGMRRDIFRRVDKPPDPNRIARWQAEMSASELVAFEKVAGTMLLDLGYSRGTNPPGAK